MLVGLYVAAIRPREEMQGSSNSKAIGLAAVDQAEPLGFWRPTRVAGVVGGVPQAVSLSRAALKMNYDRDKAEHSGSADRKVVRTTNLEMLVQRPAETAEKIRAVAEREGGFLVSSDVRGDPGAGGGSISIRVPSARFEEARSEIRKMGLRIESERIEAQDVTRQYTDQDANLRNLRAEEQQYLLILKQARTVKDILDVSEKLGDVRGQIEQQQAEFNALSKQIETVAINVSLRAEAEARVMGLNWRPLYQIKMALRDGLDGLASYFSTMIAFVFFAPTLALWVATTVLGAAIAWRILRWVGRRWFGWKRASATLQA